MNKVRDFIYLDKRRVLSFGSQLLGGIADAITISKDDSKQHERKIEAKGTVGGNFNLGNDTTTLLRALIGMIGKVDVGISGEVNPYFSTINTSAEERTEQRLLDHFQFTLLRNALVEQKLLLNLDDFKQNEWDNGKALEKIKPGDFIELTCRVKLLDVTHLESIANTIEKLVETIQQMNIFEQAEKRHQSGENLDEYLAEIQKSPVTMGYEITKSSLGGNVNPLQFNALIELMKNISKEGFTSIPVQVIARPKLVSSSGTKFVAPIRTEYLIDSKEELIFKYGYEPEQDWKLIAQVCKIPKKKNKKKIEFDKYNFSSMTALDEIVQELTDTFMDLSLDIGMHSFVKYPDVSINLIALYR